MRFNINKLLTFFLILIFVFGIFLWIKILLPKYQKKPVENLEDYSPFSNYQWIENPDKALSRIPDSDIAVKLAKIGNEYIFESDYNYLTKDEQRESTISAKFKQIDQDKLNLLIEESKIIQTAAYLDLVVINSDTFNNPYKNQKSRQYLLYKAVKELLTFYTRSFIEETLFVPYSDKAQDQDIDSSAQAYQKISDLRQKIENQELSIFRAKTLIDYKQSKNRYGRAYCSDIKNFDKLSDDETTLCDFYVNDSIGVITPILNIKDYYEDENSQKYSAYVVVQKITWDNLDNQNLKLNNKTSRKELIDFYKNLPKNIYLDNYSESLELELY